MTCIRPKRDAYAHNCRPGRSLASLGEILQHVHHAFQKSDVDTTVVVIDLDELYGLSQCTERKLVALGHVWRGAGQERFWARSKYCFKWLRPQD